MYKQDDISCTKFLRNVLTRYIVLPQYPYLELLVEAITVIETEDKARKEELRGISTRNRIKTHVEYSASGLSVPLLRLLFHQRVVAGDISHTSLVGLQ